YAVPRNPDSSPHARSAHAHRRSPGTTVRRADQQSSSSLRGALRYLREYSAASDCRGCPKTGLDQASPRHSACVDRPTRHARNPLLEIVPEDDHQKKRILYLTKIHSERSMRRLSLSSPPASEKETPNRTRGISRGCDMRSST